MPEPKASERKRPTRAGALYIVSIADIPIYVHYSFLLVMALIMLPGNFLGLEGVSGLVFFLLVFASVLLHELGHALAARRFKIKTEDIVLYPIGGIARLRSMGEGLQEFWIAIAGPAVNVLIVLALFGWERLHGDAAPLAKIIDNPVRLGPSLMLANVTLFLFNLIPAYPMDGGRVLRSLLTTMMSRETATAVATRVGQALAIGFVLLGLFGGLGIMAVFIGIFVYVAAGQEYEVTRSQALMGGHLVHQAMITHFDVLRHGNTLGHAADLLLSTNQQDFPVMLGEQVVGVLSRRRLIYGLAEKGRDEYIAPYMDREFARIGPMEELGNIYTLLSQHAGSPVMVFDGEQLVGYVTQENLMEFMMVQQVEHLPHRG